MMDGRQTVRTPPARQRRARRGPVLGLAFGVVVLALVASGIIERRDHLASLRDTAREEALPQVQVIVPAHAPALRQLDLPGTVSAWHSAPIYAQVSGYVRKWYKDYGASVKAGDLLATIDAPSLDEQFETAKANLDVVETRYKLAQATAKRWKALSGTKAVSQESIDTQAGNATAEHAQVVAAQHEVARYQALEQFKQVVAPFDGVVTSRNTDIGDYVTAAGGDAGGPNSTELFTVADIHEMRVFVPVPQDYAGMLEPGLTATLSTPQAPRRIFDLTFQTTAQAFSPQSRTVVTELTVDNADHAIWPGTYANVHFSVSVDPELLVIPEQALLFRAQGMQVAVVQPNDTVRLQDVKLGLNLGLNVQVLSGLAAGTRLVNNPSASLLQGEAVHVVPGVPGIAPAAEFRPGVALPPATHGQPDTGGRDNVD